MDSYTILYISLGATAGAVVVGFGCYVLYHKVHRARKRKGKKGDAVPTDANTAAVDCGDEELGQQESVAIGVSDSSTSTSITTTTPPLRTCPTPHNFDVVLRQKELEREEREEIITGGDVLRLGMDITDSLAAIVENNVPVIGVAASLFRQFISLCVSPKCNKEAFTLFRGRMELLYNLYFGDGGLASAAQGSEAALIAPVAERLKGIIEEGIDSLTCFSTKGFLGNLIRGHDPVKEFIDLDDKINSCLNDMNTVLQLQTRRDSQLVYETVVDVKGKVARFGWIKML
jgi:hypothetical protein